MAEAIREYLRDLRETYASNRATEHSYRPALKNLFEGQGHSIRATNEPRRVACGAPDFIVTRGQFTVGYAEAKDLDAKLDEVERSDQLKRYRRSLPNLLLTNHLEFRWYIDGEPRGEPVIYARLRDDGITPVPGADVELSKLLHSFHQYSPEPIRNPEDLARRMARLTHMIHDIIIQTFEQKEASANQRDLLRSFRNVLIPDLSESDFADMFAQTLAYGLFAARLHHTGAGSFTRLGAANAIPRANPFLRQIFGAITGIELNDEPFVDFVDDLAQLLDHADIAAVLENFGKRTRREDPVVHFYETFLSVYDPEVRELRGVYYTPEPVVNYIVRSVDAVLKDRFNAPNGLADNSKVTYQTTIATDGKEQTVEKESHRVLILDPAVGTGSFLYAVVNEIRDHFVASGNAGLWSGYVRDHLLPRIIGFELLMAPYAVAHLKLGMQLAGQDLPDALRHSWGYDFGDNERLGVYLTNSLDEATPRIQARYLERFIADEAQAAAGIKREMPVLVILGNPPYSGHSANKSWDTVGNRRTKTFIGRLLDDYYSVDGKPLNERNSKWLQDDYVKFIRWAQWRIDQTGSGILAYITNHAYLTNPTFRGMRQQLLRTFDHIYILDLHGSVANPELPPEGMQNGNVFDIKRGVAISIFVKDGVSSQPAQVHHLDLWGTREEKYAWLTAAPPLHTIAQEIEPAEPFYLFTPQDRRIRDEYNRGWSLRDIFGVNSIGIVTGRDDLAIAFKPAVLHERIRAFNDERMSDSDIHSTYLKASDKLDVRQARSIIRGQPHSDDSIERCLYRPFDQRWIWYDDAVIERSRKQVMQHLLAGNNVALISARSNKSFTPDHFFCSRMIVETKCGERTTQSYTFPLYTHAPNTSRPDTQREFDSLESWPLDDLGRRSNLSPQFAQAFAALVGLDFIPSGCGDLISTIGSDDILHYIYAIVHSPSYRARYVEFLRLDFPRIHITKDAALMRALCQFGSDLLAVHLLEDYYPSSSWVKRGELSPLLQRDTRYEVPGEHVVAPGYPKHSSVVSETGTVETRVHINSSQYISGISDEIWMFQVGGYQVCEKWLKDRRGRALTYDDFEHYQRVVAAIRETLRLIDAIDEVIPGWPLE